MTADIIVDGLFKRKKCCPGQERRIGPEKQRFKGCLAVRPRSTLEILHQEHPKYFRASLNRHVLVQLISFIWHHVMAYDAAIML